MGNSSRLKSLAPAFPLARGFCISFCGQADGLSAGLHCAVSDLLNSQAQGLALEFIFHEGSLGGQ